MELLSAKLLNMKYVPVMPTARTKAAASGLDDSIFDSFDGGLVLLVTTTGMCAGDSGEFLCSSGVSILASGSDISRI